MALKNMISIEFTAAELKTMDEALTSLQKVLTGKVVNLTPEQRKQYGSIAEQNKLFVNKAKKYMEAYPEYVPVFLVKDEFDRDYEVRNQIEMPSAKLMNLTEQLFDTKVLLDHDNYHNALTFYSNIRYLSSQDVPGISTIYGDLKQFFMGESSKKEEEDKEAPKE